MKKIMIILFILSAVGALYFPKDNYLSLACKILSFALLAYIIMNLMRKVPSKNIQENDEDDEK